jgi:hypothetical protein
MLVLGDCWRKIFWITLGNSTGMDCTTFWLRISARRKKLEHVKESAHKRRKVVRILRHFFHIVTGLPLL